MTIIECPDCGNKIEIQGHEGCIDCPECDTLIILGYEGAPDSPNQRLWESIGKAQGAAPPAPVPGEDGERE